MINALLSLFCALQGSSLCFFYLSGKSLQRRIITDDQVQQILYQYEEDKTVLKHNFTKKTFFNKPDCRIFNPVRTATVGQKLSCTARTNVRYYQTVPCALQACLLSHICKTRKQLFSANEHAPGLIVTKRGKAQRMTRVPT